MGRILMVVGLTLLMVRATPALEYPRHVVMELEQAAQVRFPRVDPLGVMDSYQMLERNEVFFALTIQGGRGTEHIWAVWAHRQKRWTLVYQLRTPQGDDSHTDEGNPRFRRAFGAAGLNAEDQRKLLRGLKTFPSFQTRYPAWKEELLHSLYQSVVLRTPETDDTHMSAKVLPRPWTAAVYVNSSRSYEVWQWVDKRWVFRLEVPWLYPDEEAQLEHELEVWRASGLPEALRQTLLKQSHGSLPHGWR